MANRFVMCIFGDLKNYVYHYKFATLEHDVSHINQAKANKVSALLKPEVISELVTSLEAILLKAEEDQIEIQSMKVGEILCVLDPSPKLPSALIINHVCKAEVGTVLLIREKLSRLSPKVTLDLSIVLNLEFGKVEAP